MEHILETPEDAQNNTTHLPLEPSSESTFKDPAFYTEPETAILPNRHQAVRGRNAEGQTVHLSHSIAQKLYRCASCALDIQIGDEHAIMSIVQTMDRNYNHHHLDLRCVRDTILPSLKHAEIIEPQKADASRINKKRRQYRNKYRKQFGELKK
jgi:hypothetical protein